MDNKSRVLKIAGTKINAREICIKLPLQKLFEECLNFISVESFEI